jgi:uncharacterized membrane protein HdeD (DUF308 family)
MKKNMGRTDQIIRLVAGIVLLALGILVPMSDSMTWLSIVLIVIGVLALVTGIFAICPLYIVLKKNTLGK